MAGSKRKNGIDKNSLSCYNENALQKRFCFLLAWMVTENQNFEKNILKSTCFF